MNNILLTKFDPHQRLAESAPSPDPNELRRLDRDRGFRNGMGGNLNFANDGEGGPKRKLAWTAEGRRGSQEMAAGAKAVATAGTANDREFVIRIRVDKD